MRPTTRDVDIGRRLRRDRLDAVVSDWQGTVDGDAMHILNVAAVGATRACDFQWFNAPGHEASDRAGVLQLLASLTVD